MRPGGSSWAEESAISSDRFKGKIIFHLWIEFQKRTMAFLPSWWVREKFGLLIASPSPVLSRTASVGRCSINPC